MQYRHVLPGVFLKRINRFIVCCLIDGIEQVCHLKNTGRLEELLLPGAKIYLEHTPSPTRKTQYDIIGVEKEGVLFNIDSIAPNKAAGEWLPSFLGDIDLLQAEYSFSHSRIDFYATRGEEQILIEVKGVTLLRDGCAYFPDAPTVRGTKHLKELIKAVNNGYTCYCLFVIQTEHAEGFAPNVAADPAFAVALWEAYTAGVRLLAYTCLITPDSMKIHQPLSLSLSSAFCDKNRPFSP